MRYLQTATVVIFFPHQKPRTHPGRRLTPLRRRRQRVLQSPVQSLKPKSGRDPSRPSSHPLRSSVGSLSSLSSVKERYPCFLLLRTIPGREGEESKHPPSVRPNSRLKEKERAGETGVHREENWFGSFKRVPTTSPKPERPSVEVLGVGRVRGLGDGA